MSKLLGEWLAAETPRHYVLRVESLFGGARAGSSVDKILDGILAGREVRAFADRTVSPSYVDDVVMATRALARRPPAVRPVSLRQQRLHHVGAARAGGGPARRTP